MQNLISDKPSILWPLSSYKILFVSILISLFAIFTISLQCDSAMVTNEIRVHAQEIAERYNFNGFIEASAKDNLKVESIFEEAVCLVS